MAGETLAGYLKAQGRQKEDIRIVVLQGTEGATATIGRSAGFDEVAKRHPNWLILEQVDAEFTTAKGQEAVSYTHLVQRVYCHGLLHGGPQDCGGP